MTQPAGKQPLMAERSSLSPHTALHNHQEALTSPPFTQNLYRGRAGVGILVTVLMTAQGQRREPHGAAVVSLIPAVSCQRVTVLAVHTQNNCHVLTV